MTHIIRSARVREPLLLLRKTEKAEEQAAPLPPPAPKISYDEYEQRFQAELDELRAEARERGWQQGHERGRAKAAAEHAAQLKALATLVRAGRGRLDDGIGELSGLGAGTGSEGVCTV